MWNKCHHDSAHSLLRYSYIVSTVSRQIFNRFETVWAWNDSCVNEHLDQPLEVIFSDSLGPIGLLKFTGVIPFHSSKQSFMNHITPGSMLCIPIFDLAALDWSLNGFGRHELAYNRFWLRSDLDSSDFALLFGEHLGFGELLSLVSLYSKVFKMFQIANNLQSKNPCAGYRK